MQAGGRSPGPRKTKKEAAAFHQRGSLFCMACGRSAGMCRPKRAEAPGFMLLRGWASGNRLVVCVARAVQCQKRFLAGQLLRRPGRLIQIVVGGGGIAEGLEPLGLPRVSEAHPQAALESDGVLVVEAVHGGHRAQRVLQRDAVVRAAEFAVPEIPAPVEIILQSGAHDLRMLDVVLIDADVFRRLEIGEVVVLLPCMETAQPT